ncbi:MAG: NAD kinase [Vicingaceae bacterium]
MTFGIYSNSQTDVNLQAVAELRSFLDAKNITYTVFEDLNQTLSSPHSISFSSKDELISQAGVLITIGGDGTILSAIHFVANSEVPVLGVNTGRLGFLTSLTIAEMPGLLDEILQKKFNIEERALLDVTASDRPDKEPEISLNEVSVLKKDSSSMITIHAELDGELLNTYWADGLIISTATGSTAYSLSCGGPIVMPGSGNLIITPIAPHNLNVRPLVIDDESEIRLWFETRSSDLMIALDSSSRIVHDNVSIRIRKSKSTIKLLRQESYSYLETLRNKLNWGLDQRN